MLSIQPGAYDQGDVRGHGVLPINVPTIDDIRVGQEVSIRCRNDQGKKWEQSIIWPPPKNATHRSTRKPQKSSKDSTDTPAEVESRDFRKLAVLAVGLAIIAYFVKWWRRRRG